MGGRLAGVGAAWVLQSRGGGRFLPGGQRRVRAAHVHEPLPRDGATLRGPHAVRGAQRVRHEENPKPYTPETLYPRKL